MWVSELGHRLVSSKSEVDLQRRGFGLVQEPIRMQRPPVNYTSKVILKSMEQSTATVQALRHYHPHFLPVAGQTPAPTSLLQRPRISSASAPQPRQQHLKSSNNLPMRP